MLRRALPILLLLLTLLPGCATNPVSGKKEVALMSEEKEITIGRQADPEIRKEYGVYDDAKLQAYVQQVGQKLAGLSHRPELFYRFTVLDSQRSMPSRCRAGTST
jgi:predicted Zn-dependent protease